LSWFSRPCRSGPSGKKSSGPGTRGLSVGKMKWRDYNVTFSAISWWNSSPVESWCSFNVSFSENLCYIEFLHDISCSDTILLLYLMLARWCLAYWKYFRLVQSISVLFDIK
jgi:hypothetical protein